MIVVSDTSPISALITLECADLLAKLYGEIIIPSAVSCELLAYHQEIPDFIRISTIQDSARLTELKRKLDPGEAEAIILAAELNADLLLIDEALGRNEAKRAHLPVIGLMGVLLIAKKKNLIESITQIIQRLETEAGFYLSRLVKQRIIQEAGE